MNFVSTRLRFRSIAMKTKAMNQEQLSLLRPKRLMPRAQKKAYVHCSMFTSSYVNKTEHRSERSNMSMKLGIKNSRTPQDSSTLGDYSRRNRPLYNVTYTIVKTATMLIGLRFVFLMSRTQT